MSDGQAAAVLWGTDHEELGVVGSRNLGDAIGLALTRGRHPKAYRYEDPNEDAVAAVAGAEATLLVCADGHHGAFASRTAVQAVLDGLGAAPPRALTDAAWLELFEQVNATVIAGKGVGAAQPASNTVLIAALVAPGHLSWAALGDAALVVARPGAAPGTQLNKEAARFVGQPMKGRQLKRGVQRGQTPLDDGDWVVAVTDGLSAFVAPRRPAEVVPEALAQAADAGAEAAARALVDAANDAGAGDNVGAVVIRPTTSG